jgi:polar amino acid transport system substrate-binding protein
MKVRFLIPMLLFSAAVLFAGGSAEGSNSETDPLVVAMELQFPPFEMTDAQGNPSGISVDLAKAFGEYIGRPVEIRNTAWVGLIPSLRSGEADLVWSSMTITEEREELVDFSIPYVQAGLTLLISNESTVNGFEDLNSPEVVIAVKSGTTGATLAQEEYPQATIRQFEEVAACVLEVAQGKADVFIYDAITVYESQKNHAETTRLNISSIPGTFAYWGAAVKEGNTELKAQVDEFIRYYRTDGGFRELGSKYLGDIQKVFDDAGVAFFFEIED